MNRTAIIFTVGACVLALGAYLVLQGHELSTAWQAGPGGYGRVGITDQSLRQAYRTLGLAGLGMGSARVGMAAWHWLVAERRDTYPRPASRPDAPGQAPLRGPRCARRTERRDFGEKVEQESQRAALLGWQAAPGASIGPAPTPGV